MLLLFSNHIREIIFYKKDPFQAQRYIRSKPERWRWKDMFYHNLRNKMG